MWLRVRGHAEGAACTSAFGWGDGLFTAALARKDEGSRNSSLSSELRVSERQGAWSGGGWTITDQGRVAASWSATHGGKGAY